MARKSFVTILLIACIASVCCENTKLEFSSTDCTIVEPIYGHKFDLNGLHSELAHQVDEVEKGDTFIFNVCGNVSRSCDGRKDVAACLKRRGKEYVLGTHDKLNYNNGRMYFTFEDGAKCPTSPGGNSSYKLYVMVGCDYTLDEKQAQVTPYSDDICSFYIRLETPLACLPEPDDVSGSLCSVKDGHTGHMYNLSSLNDVNYRTTDRNGNLFVLNICKPVLYGQNAMCPKGSSVCFVDLKTTDIKKKFFNYGTAQPNPIIENGQLIIRHTSETHCNATDYYSSVINFYCGVDVKNAHPEYVGSHGCEHTFSFVTPLACSTQAPCTAITSNAEIIDLSALKGKPLTLSMQDKKYTFGVCQNAGEPCLQKDGACSKSGDQTMSLGTANSNLLVDYTGTPYLLYENGAKCEKSTGPTGSTTSTFWSTKIEFVCANNATKDNGNSSAGSSSGGGGSGLTAEPKIIENSNCQLLIQYQTPLACHEQISCRAKAYSLDGSGYELVDLTPLINAVANYEALINTTAISEQQVDKHTKFFLNVCRPLVPVYGLGCAGGSAACMANVASPTATPENELSLGYPKAGLVAFDRTTAELGYFKGGPCPHDAKEQLTTKIRFTCDMQAGRGTAMLQAINGCQYQFSWATNVICPPHMCDFDADTCEINNGEIKAKYNLKTAPFTKQGKITVEKDKKSFDIDICGANRKAVTDYSQGLMNLFFSVQHACDTHGYLNVQIRLICSAEAQPEITFTEDKQCNLLYVQRTPDICKFLGLQPAADQPKPPATTSQPSVKTTTTTSATTTTTKSPQPDDNGDKNNSNNNNSGDNHPAERTASVGAILGAILSVTFFVACLGVLAFSPERRNSLRRLFRRTSSAVRYSRVQSNEEANLLMERNGEFTDSDDDMLL